MWPMLIALALESTTVRRIAVAPAETLTVAVGGRAGGSVVAMIPGLFGATYGFRHLAGPLMDAGHRVIIIEPLAVGTSGRPRRSEYSLHAQAARIAAVLDSLDTRDAVLVGHSVGGGMVLRVALRRPELVRAIVSLEGGPAESASTPGFRRAMQFAPFIRMFGGFRRVRGEVRKGLVRSSADSSWVTDEVIDAYTAGAARDFNATLLAYMRIAEAREPERLAPRLAELRCPVRLVLGGAPHGSGPSDAEVARLRESVRDFGVVTVPAAGHYPHEEQPAAVVRVVLEAAGGR